MFPEILKSMGAMDTFSKIEGCNCTHCTPIAEALYYIRFIILNLIDSSTQSDSKACGGERPSGRFS